MAQEQAGPSGSRVDEAEGCDARPTQDTTARGGLRALLAERRDLADDDPARHSLRELLRTRVAGGPSGSGAGQADSSEVEGEDVPEVVPVSYTHLTLPTIYSV